MLWDKTKYRVNLRGGKGHFKTSGMHGIVDHIIIRPENRHTIWSARIIDQEFDIIYEVYDHQGRLDDKEGLPVGKDQPQRIIVEIFDATKNDLFDIMFKVRESR